MVVLAFLLWILKEEGSHDCLSGGAVSQCLLLLVVVVLASLSQAKSLGFPMPHNAKKKAKSKSHWSDSKGKSGKVRREQPLNVEE